MIISLMLYYFIHALSPTPSIFYNNVFKQRNVHIFGSRAISLASTNSWKQNLGLSFKRAKRDKLPNEIWHRSFILLILLSFSLSLFLLSTQVECAEVTCPNNNRPIRFKPRTLKWAALYSLIAERWPTPAEKKLEKCSSTAE